LWKIFNEKLTAQCRQDQAAQLFTDMPFLPDVREKAAQFFGNALFAGSFLRFRNQTL